MGELLRLAEAAERELVEVGAHDLLLALTERPVEDGSVERAGTDRVDPDRRQLDRHRPSEGLDGGRRRRSDGSVGARSKR